MEDGGWRMEFRVEVRGRKAEVGDGGWRMEDGYLMPGCWMVDSWRLNGWFYHHSFKYLSSINQDSIISGTFFLFHI